jgi:hypothetical protein
MGSSGGGAVVVGGGTVVVGGATVVVVGASVVGASVTGTAVVGAGVVGAAAFEPEPPHADRATIAAARGMSSFFMVEGLLAVLRLGLGSDHSPALLGY